MRRWIILGWSIAGALIVILAVALATVGTQLDQARVDKEDLQFETDELQKDVDALTEERGKLQQKVDEHQKTIEQLKAELERTRGQAQTSPTP